MPTTAPVRYHAPSNALGILGALLIVSVLVGMFVVIVPHGPAEGWAVGIVGALVVVAAAYGVVRVNQRRT